MGSLELIAARQMQHQEAIAGAAHQALEAVRLAYVLGGRLEEQRQALVKVQATTTRLDRLLRPLIRLRARFRRQ